MTRGQVAYIDWHGERRQRREVMAELAAGGMKTADIARQLDVSYQNVYITLQEMAKRQRDAGSRTPADPRSAPPSERRLPSAPHAVVADAIVVGCVATKGPDPAPAKDLYRSELFHRRRLYAEASERPWWILSAEYGLVDPEATIAPYDTRMGRLAPEQRHRLARESADRLERGLGSLRGTTIELHAGQEYYDAVAPEWRSRGVEIVRPIEGLRFGEQLGWYGDQLGLARLSSAGPRVVHPVPSLPADLVGDGRGLGRRISQLFADGAFDLSGRVSAPVAGWAGMPEVRAATRLHVLGANEATLRRFLTFNAAMDRARDADRLADNAVRLFEHHAWAFDPDEITRRPLTDLVDALRASGVSQRHVPDAFGWRVMAETLSDTASSGPVGQVIAQGSGDALELLAALDAESAAGTPRFPLLRGPKIGPLWVRLMAYPGGARINSLGQLPVAVDVQVRKVTEYLGVTDTGGLSLDDVRAAIQETWARDVERNGVIGPAQLGATTGALDPALWFYAKWGCTFCERAGTKLPISPVCDSCRFPERGRTREPESPGSLKTSTAIDAGQEDWAD